MQPSGAWWLALLSWSRWEQRPPGQWARSGGGADANVWNASGLECVNLCNGMAEIHTASEHIAAADLDAMLDITLALVDAARNPLQPSTIGPA